MEERRTIGERLLERIDRRADGHVRPTTTQAYEDRYSRFARTKGMSRLGLSLFPDMDDTWAAPVANAADASSPTFLSGAPFWARMRRIGEARLRRQQWLAGLGNKFGQRSVKTRSAPSAPTGLSSIFGPDALSMDSLVLLEPEETIDPDALTDESGRRLGDGAPGGSSPSAWFTGSSFVPAPVIKGMRGGRPMQRAEARAPAPVIIQKVVEQVVRSAKAGLPEVMIEEIPAALAAKVRRAVRRQAKKLGSSQADAEAALPDEFAPPSAIAAGRAPSRRGGRKRGLRTMAASSPMMAEIAAPVEENVLPAGDSVVERTAHRSQTANAGGKLSASPVGRPTPSRRRASVSQPVSEAVFDAVGDPPAPSILGASRASAVGPRPQHVPVDSASLAAAERIEAPAGRTGRSRRAAMSYTADPTVVVPDGGMDFDDVEAEAATPTRPRNDKPGAPVVRSTARVAQRAAAVARERSSQPQSKGFAAPSSDGEPRTRNVTRRASALSRSSDGRFVSVAPEAQAEVEADSPVATEQPLAGTAQRTRTHKTASATVMDAATPETAPVVGASYAAQRLEQAETQAGPVAESQRSLIPRPAPHHKMADALVLPTPEDAQELDSDLPADVPKASVAKSSPGVRAAARVSRTPVVGYTAARTASGSTTPAERTARSARTKSRPRREGLVSYAATPSTPETVTIAVPMQQEQVQHQMEEGAVPSEQLVQRGVRAARATHGTSRPLDWTGARVELIAPDALPMPGTRTARARARTTEAGAFVPAQRTQTSLRPRTVDAESSMVLPEPQMTASEAEAEAGAAAGAAAEAEGRQEDRRVGFDHTVRGVGAGRVDSEMPIWAQRATGAPRIRGSEDLVDALAKAGRPDEVVQVLMERSSEMSTVASALPTPVIQVIEQIQTEAGKVAEDIAASQTVLPPTSGRSRPGDRGQVRSTARVVRGMTGLRPSSGTSSSSGAGVQKVTALAQRLQQLINMAESNRDSARREVRMAEDSSAARAEGSAAPATVDGEQDSTLDVDALAQEVTDAVTRELEMRQERRLDDPTGRSIWWE